MLAILLWSLLFPFQFGPGQFPKGMQIPAPSVRSWCNALGSSGLTLWRWNNPLERPVPGQICYELCLGSSHSSLSQYLGDIQKEKRVPLALEAVLGKMRIPAQVDHAGGGCVPWSLAEVLRPVYLAGAGTGALEQERGPRSGGNKQRPAPLEKLAKAEVRTSQRFFSCRPRRISGLCCWRLRTGERAAVGAKYLPDCVGRTFIISVRYITTRLSYHTSS